MKKIGIICEFNPFHNGHIYLIEKIKEMYKDSIIICVLSGNFVERGEVSIINKWEKTKLALKNNVDLVIELPFCFASQSADIFCKGSIELLKCLNVDTIVFGSECNDINLLKECAYVSLTHEYNTLVKEYMDLGNSYPSSMMKALKKLKNIETLGPNDTLGVGYIKEIIKQNSNIEPITIKRTNEYHSTSLNNNIVSAKAIRNALKNNQDISKYIPFDIKEKELHFNEDYFNLLKYKIISEENLEKYQTVDEGIENRLKKYILEVNSLDELLEKVKTKRYTYHKLSRMFIHILTSFTKDEAKNLKDIRYIRVLGFNNKGKKYLKEIKKSTNLKIITNYINDPMLNLERRTSLIYDGKLEEKMIVIKGE